MPLWTLRRLGKTIFQENIGTLEKYLITTLQVRCLYIWPCYCSNIQIIKTDWFRINIDPICNPNNKPCSIIFCKVIKHLSEIKFAKFRVWRVTKNHMIYVIMHPVSHDYSFCEGFLSHIAKAEWSSTCHPCNLNNCINSFISRFSLIKSNMSILLCLHIGYEGFQHCTP